MSSRIKIKIELLEHFDPSLPLPSYQTTGASGADLRANLPKNKRKLGLTIPPGDKILIPTGLSVEVPEGFELQVRPRSGVSFKTGLFIPNSPGTIDSDYRGEINIILGNRGRTPESVFHGDRLAQLVLCPVYQALFVESPSLRHTGGSKASALRGVPDLSQMKHPITLLFEDKSEVTFDLHENESLLEGAKREGHFIRSSCGGFASCSECVIKVCGESALNAPTPEEVRLLGNVFYLTKERLSCQTFVKGKAAFDLSSHNPKAPPLKKKKRFVPSKRKSQKKTVLKGSPKRKT